MIDEREVEFLRELASLLNRYSLENESNTPDYVLATYVRECLRVFAKASKSREGFYGTAHYPGGIAPPGLSRRSDD